MAITSSAKKVIRASERKRVFNVRAQKKIDVVIKDIRKFVTAKKKADAIKLIPTAYKAIDKAIKTNYLNKNAGARIKSRLVRGLNK